MATMRNADIALVRGRSVKTVKAQLRSAMEKTGADNRTHLYALVTSSIDFAVSLPAKEGGAVSSSRAGRGWPRAHKLAA